MKTCLITGLMTLAALTATATAIPPHTITSLYKDGDDAGGVGVVTLVNTMVVNNSGMWLVELDTDNFDTTADLVVMRSGALYLREGQNLNVDGTIRLSSMDDFTLNNAGNSGWNIFLDGPASNADSGLFFNDTIIFQEGFLSTASGLSPGTPYIGFFGTKMNDGNQLLVVASIDDPAIASTVDRAMMLVDYNTATGSFTETVLAKEGETLPGTTGPVADFGTDHFEFDLNNSGAAMFLVDVASTAPDAIFLGGSVLAIEGGLAVAGEPGPADDRNWELLDGRPVDLNNAGGYVFRGNLSGATTDDEVLFRNGAVFVSEGASLPVMGGFALTAFGTGPVLIDDNNNVVWYGDWNDPDTTRDKALFWNLEPLLQEGVSMIDGLVVDTIRGITDGYSMSNNGRYITVRVVLDDPFSTTGIDAALLIAFSGCGSADFDGDGDTGTDLDIEAFFACLGGDCCAACGSADFDGDSDVGTDLDIEAFFRVLGGGAC